MGSQTAAAVVVCGYGNIPLPPDTSMSFPELPSQSQVSSRIQAYGQDLNEAPSPGCMQQLGARKKVLCQVDSEELLCDGGGQLFSRGRQCR